MLRRLRHRLPSLAIRSIYIASVRPALEYAAVAWCGVRSGEVQLLERKQRSAARLIAGVSQSDELPHDILLAQAGLEPLHLRRQAACAVFAYSLYTRDQPLPPHMAAALASWHARLPKPSSSVVLRSSQSFLQRLPRPRTELFRCSPFYLSFSLLNSVSPDQSISVSSFRSFFLSPLPRQS